MAKKISVALELDTSKFDASLNKSKQQAQGLTGKLGGVKTAIVGAAAAAAGGIAISGIIETTKEIEQLEGAFRTIFPTTEEATAKFAEMQTLANQLGTDATTLREAFVTLKQAGVEPTTEMLTAFVDMSKNANDELGAVRTSAELFAKTVSGGLGLEQLDVLLTKNVNAYAILEEQLGITRGEISEFGKTAEGAATIQQALIKGFQEKFGESAARELESIASQLHIVNNTSQEAQYNFGKGLAPAITEFSKAVTEAIANNQQLITDLGRLVGEGLVALIENLNIVIPIIQGFAAAWAVIQFAKLAEGIKLVVGGIRMLTAAIAANPLGALLVAVTTAIAYFVAFAQEVGSVKIAFYKLAAGAVEGANTIINGHSEALVNLSPHCSLNWLRI